jgi:hypothetical protein
MKKLTKEDFIKKSDLIHKSEYYYSLVDYVNARTKVTIICKIRGEFLQKLTTHLNGKGCGSGCPKCLGIISKCETEFLNHFNLTGQEIPFL